MPHQIIEYSGNLDVDIDIGQLLGALHETAVSLDTLPTAGIRTRAARREHYRIADGNEDNAFINVTLRIAAGRTAAQKKEAGDRLFDTLKRFVNDIYPSRPLALSLEIQEIDPEFRWKQGNIRDFMAARDN